ncbi:MAG: GGDEF domain-containing protein [Thermoanaerobaculales bacterium]|jgi:diguanylate cyclase (GGDEF)-like protein|nr:GGDEF domain-containing protein [Thermoanaerobaculales bacterium]
MEQRDHDTADRTWALRGPATEGGVASGGGNGGQAILILIAHPDNQRLGSRTRLDMGSTVTIGRDPQHEVAFPEVPSLSRAHARIEFTPGGVSVEDLESTNGTFVNDHRVVGREALGSGDRIQFGALHFKLLREEDVEAAYHEAIHQLVMQDGLTEIGNRRRFTDELAREFARAQRHERPLAVVVFDIDRFKEINDAHGHLCGDFVLKRLARVCRARLRPEQVFARIGGDEFAILSPETGIGGVEILAGRLRESIADHLFETDMVAGAVRVTCSFGCAALTPGMTSEAELMEAADRALYASKEAGRNRVESAAAPSGREGE